MPAFDARAMRGGVKGRVEKGSLAGASRFALEGGVGVRPPVAPIRWGVGLDDGALHSPRGRAQSELGRNSLDQGVGVLVQEAFGRRLGGEEGFKQLKEFLGVFEILVLRPHQTLDSGLGLGAPPRDLERGFGARVGAVLDHAALGVAFEFGVEREGLTNAAADAVEGVGEAALFSDVVGGQGSLLEIARQTIPNSASSPSNCWGGSGDRRACEQK